MLTARSCGEHPASPSQDARAFAADLMRALGEVGFVNIKFDTDSSSIDNCRV
jgi:hypothetical protein